MLAVMQAVLLEALRHDEPIEHLRAAAADPSRELDEPERALLRAVDPAGLRVSGLLCRKLRFQRLIADAGLRERFDADPRAFAGRFRDYERRHPPRALLPEDELAAFRAFEAESAGDRSASSRDAPE